MAIIACWLWSTAFPAVKIGLQYADPLMFGGVRFILAGIVLLPWCRPFGSLGSTIRNHWGTILVVSFFQTSFLYGLFFWGMRMVPAALAAITYGASPLIAALVAHFTMRNDRMSFRKLAGIMVGVTGVALITLGRKPWSSPASLTELWGLVILITASISSAFGNVVVARDRKDINPFHLTAVQMFAGGVTLFIAALAIGHRFKGIPPLSFHLAMGWLVLVSAAGFSIWFVLLKKPGVSVSGLNVWKFIMPVSGAILSWFLLPDESASWLQIGGMGLVAAGIIVSARSGPKPIPAAGPPA